LTYCVGRRLHPNSISLYLGCSLQTHTGFAFGHGVWHELHGGCCGLATCASPCLPSISGSALSACWHSLSLFVAGSVAAPENRLSATVTSTTAACRMPPPQPRRPPTPLPLQPPTPSPLPHTTPRPPTRLHSWVGHLHGRLRSAWLRTSPSACLGDAFHLPADGHQTTTTATGQPTYLISPETPISALPTLNVGHIFWRSGICLTFWHSKNNLPIFLYSLLDSAIFLALQLRFIWDIRTMPFLTS